MAGTLPHGVTQLDVDHFKRVSITQSTFQDSAFAITAGSREYTSDGGHTLTGKTWNTPETIPHLISFYRPALTSSSAGHGSDSSTRSELRRFYTFKDGLNAHEGSLHGGVVACLLDSALSNYVALHCGAKQVGGTVFTLTLTVSYKKPVPTPGTAMIRAWTTTPADGRKYRAQGTIETNGVVHAYAEGLWLEARPRL